MQGFYLSASAYYNHQREAKTQEPIFNAAGENLVCAVQGKSLSCSHTRCALDIKELFHYAGRK